MIFPIFNYTTTKTFVFVQRVIEVICELAARVLILFATCHILYHTLPASISSPVILFAGLGTTYSTAFLPLLFWRGE